MLDRFKLALSHCAYAWTMNTKLSDGLPVDKLRANFEKLAAVSQEDLLKKFSTLVFEQSGDSSLSIESIQTPDVGPGILLYFHGGGYIMGSIASYRHWTLRLAYRCKMTVWTPDYRLAPEHPFPAALEDAKKAYALLIKKHPGKPIYFGGDSAGGGLALATLMALRDSGAPLPKGAFLISPYADLSATSQSMKRNRFKDLWLSKKRIEKWAPLYYANTPVNHPLVSPVRGNFRGLPPLYVQVAGNEVLLDDAVSIVENAKAAGVEAKLDVFPGMQHAWPVALTSLAESKAALRSIDRFLSSLSAK